MKNFQITNKRVLIEAIISTIIFCIISYLSRFIVLLFGLVVVFGIAFPLIWAKVKKDWASIGFTKKSLGKAFIWGAGSGAVIFIYLFSMVSKACPLLQTCLV